MKFPSVRGVLAVALLTPVTAFAATDTEIAELKTMLKDIKAQYEQRIRSLENRITTAEREAAAAKRAQAAAARQAQASIAKSASAPVARPDPAVPAGQSSAGKSSVLGALTSGSAFNPQISVILNGNYYKDDVDGEGATFVGEALQPAGGSGHDHGDEEDEDHAHGTTENGFNFREAEIAFSATVDPYFDAHAYLAVDGDGDLDLEEAYLQTRGLPYGLRLKGGKFLSEFGYINKQHPHQWDFADQNLPYLNLLGDHGLQDTGVQLTWLPKLPVYTLLGVEVLHGSQEIFGTTLDDDEQDELNLGDTRDGPRLWTAFAKVAPELGENHALQIGVSYAHTNQHQEVHSHEDEGEEEENGLAGKGDLWGTEIVYKYDADRAYGQGDIKLQAEYLRSVKDLKIRSNADAELIGSRRKFTTDGFYAQASYGFLPRWRVGVRYDVLGLTNKTSGGESADFDSSDRWTLGLTWNLSEFSQLRAQYARNNILVAEGERERFDAFYLQFLLSLGPHGAHKF